MTKNDQRREKLKWLIENANKLEYKKLEQVLTDAYERRRVAWHVVYERRRDLAASRRSTMIMITICTGAVSVISWTAARFAPMALFILPAFLFYCGALVLLREKHKAARLFVR